MKVAVVGSRDWPSVGVVNSVLDELPKEGLVLVSGGARGVDSMARNWAFKNNIPIIEYFPDWTQGVRAGLARNTLIITDADLVLAFQYNNSRGTQDSINKACYMGIPVLVYK